MPPPPTERRSSAARLLALTSRGKPTIEITLDDDQSEAFVPSYTTLEKIQGTVTITAASETAVDDVLVSFQGSIRTYVERVAVATPGNARIQANHTFLRLVQPINAADMPTEGLLLANRPYSFPFTFVVPETLLPQACTHPVEHPDVYAAHLTPPPSMGDPMLAGDGKALLNDMCPENAEIAYKLRVVLFRHSSDGEKPRVIADSAKKVRIAPKIDELPPIRPDDYLLKQEKTIKRGIFRGKLGLLTVESAQPSSLHLPSIRDHDAARPSTMAVVNLRFDPADAGLPPPRLDQLWTRLKVATVFAAEPQRTFPPRAATYLYDDRRRSYTDTIPLAARCIGAVEWTAHRSDSTLAPIAEDGSSPPASLPCSRSSSPLPRRHSVFPIPRLSFFRRDSTFSRRDSTFSHRRPSLTSFRRASSAATIAGTSTPPTHYHTAQLLVPISLPPAASSSSTSTSSTAAGTTSTNTATSHHRTFIPSFHACLASRIYAIDVALSVLAPAATTVRLSLPLQISAAGNPSARAMIGDGEAAAIAAREERERGLGYDGDGGQATVLGDVVEPPGYWVWSGTVPTRR